MIVMNFNCSFQTIKRWIYNLAKTLLRRYHWAFALAGFLALAMAAISWTLETSETYWFWHRYYKITTILFISLSFRLPCLILLSFESLSWLKFSFQLIWLWWLKKFYLFVLIDWNCEYVFICSWLSYFF